MRVPSDGIGAHRDRDRGRPDGRCRDESGSILVLFSIFLVMFLLCCAVVVDVGYWWVAGKRAQIAADACALAAARDLPANPAWDPARTECVFAGQDYVLVNLPDQSGAEPEPLHLSTTVLSPYEDDTSMVEATVEMRVQTFFGRVVGLDWIDLTRRAVAEQQTGINEVAIHAHTTNCANDALVMNGEDLEVVGVVESNGKFEVNGKIITTGPASAGGPVECEHKVNGEDISFGGEDMPTYDPVPHPWPWYVIPSEHPFDWPNSCDVVGWNIIFDVPNEVIPPGVYCAGESFEVKAEGISGEITVFSPRININAKGTRFSPSPRAMAANKPLLFMHIPNSTPDPGDDGPGDGTSCEYNHKMELNAEEITWTGVIFSPCGHINVNGAKNAVLEGMIEAQTVRINGEDFNLTRISNLGANISLALVE